MLLNIEIEGYSLFDFALVQWYDFCHKNNKRRLYKYNCSLLKIINTYNIISTKLIIELIQIIQCAEKQNEYFANIYMF